MFAVARQLQWMQVVPRASSLYYKHASSAEALAAAIEELPKDGFLDLWRNEEDGFVRLKLNVGDWMGNTDQWREALQPHCDHLEVMDEAGGPGEDGEWVKVCKE